MTAIVERPEASEHGARERKVCERRGGRFSSSLVQTGGVVHLGWDILRHLVRGPYSWGPEFAEQFAFTIKICILPLSISSFALAFGPLGVQASGIFGLLGSYDRIGSLYEVVEVRELAPLVVGIILAGAAGTAICADLGARVIREEIPALEVMGVDPINSLVVPRAVALICASFLLNIVALVAGLAGALLVLVQHHQPIGPSVSDFLSNATALELEAATLKAGIYGTVIAIVSCYMGINVSGGAEGVGRAVNRSVVIAFTAMGFIDYLFSQLLLALFPILSAVRG